MKSRCFLGRAVVAGLLAGAAWASPGFGADTYWTGGSPQFSNWSDTRNWSGGVTPSASYGVIQFGDNARTTNNNDLGTFASNGIRFLAGAPGFTLNGSAINFFDNGGTQAKIENLSSNLSTINLGLNFTATAGTNRAEINAINGDLTVNGDIAITGSAVNELQFFGGNARTLTLSGIVSGSGKALRLTSGTTNTVVVTNAANSYSGGAFVDGGTLSVSSLSNTAGNSTIGTGNLSLGSATNAGTLLYTGAIVNWDRSVTLGAAGGTITNANAGAGNILFANGVVSGSGALTINGPGTIRLRNPSSTYTGGSAVCGGGTLYVTSLPNAAGNSAIGTGNLALNSGTLSYNGASNVSPFFNRPTTLGAGGGTFQVIGGTTLTVSGSISGAGSLTKTGGGTLTLTANNPYNGATVVSAGTLALAGASTVLTGTSGVTINAAGTLLFGGNNQINQATLPGITANGGTINAGGFSQGTGGTSLLAPGTAGLGALTLQASSIIDLAGASVLHFSPSNGAVWAANAILSILNWSGTAITGGGAEQILFGVNPTGLTAAQLLQIQFVDPAGLSAGTYAAIFATDGSGEIVPGAQVPEPATVIGGALALGLLAWTQRRRLRAWLPARA